MFEGTGDNILYETCVRELVITNTINMYDGIGDNIHYETCVRGLLITNTMKHV